MIKSKLQNNQPILIIKIASFVKDRDFSTALSDYFYNKNEPFNKKIKKSEARKILYDQLFYYGLQGEQEDGFFEASFELSEEYNSIYADDIKWVHKNYPYFKGN